jgi:hypothetical protein
MLRLPWCQQRAEHMHLVHLIITLLSTVIFEPLAAKEELPFDFPWALQRLMMGTFLCNTSGSPSHLQGDDVLSRVTPPHLHFLSQAKDRILRAAARKRLILRIQPTCLVTLPRSADRCP